jgi:hypothetical protein
LSRALQTTVEKDTDTAEELSGHVVLADKDRDGKVRCVFS